VNEEVNELLKRVKLPTESFSDTIARLCHAYSIENLQKWPQESEGWADMTEEEYEEFMKPIRAFRESFRPYME
jgi:predicted CopG family antitoxin